LRTSGPPRIWKARMGSNCPTSVSVGLHTQPAGCSLVLILAASCVLPRRGLHFKKVVSPLCPVPALAVVWCDSARNRRSSPCPSRRQPHISLSSYGYAAEIQGGGSLSLLRSVVDVYTTMLWSAPAPVPDGRPSILPWRHTGRDAASGVPQANSLGLVSDRFSGSFGVGPAIQF